MPVHRLREYLRSLLTGRQEAKEIRAFGVEAAFRHRHEVTTATFLDAPGTRSVGASGTRSPWSSWTPSR